jgi:hypothetical protein
MIWKFKLEPGSPTVNLPPGARLLHVEGIGDDAFLWALTRYALRAARLRRAQDPRLLDRRQAEIYGTYVGTFMLDDGAFVGHVFDGGESGG